MKTYHRFFVASVVLLCGVLAATLPGRTQSNHQASVSSKALSGSASPIAAREDAYRQNNLGVALLEQFKYKEAAEAFRRALQLDPKLNAARINLAIALYNVPEIDAALREAKATAEQQPGAPQPHYILGLIAKAQNRTDDSVAAFERVLKIDARDTGANINAGQLYAQQRRYPEAVAAYRIALDVEPYNMTAVYSLAQAYLRSNQRPEGQRLLQRFQELRASGSGTSIGQNYLEQGRYAEAVISTGAEPELVNNRLPNATFADATANILPPASNAKSPASVMNRRYKAADLTEEAKRELVASLGGGITLFDYDGDTDLDLFEVTASTQRLLRNDGGKFVDATAQAGALSMVAKGTGISAVAGDYDNDNKPDLFVLRHGGNTLYHNDGNGRFSDVTSAAGIPAYPFLSISTAFVDVDHDGDLDIFMAGFVDLASPSKAEAGRELVFPHDWAGAPNVLLRNNGDGKFTDTTTAAKLTPTTAASRSVAVVPTDYDNRRDVDLLVVRDGEAPALFRNLRDGSFRDVAGEVGLDARGRFTCAAAGDANKDGYTDFFFGQMEGPGLFAMSDGRGRFTTTPAEAALSATSAAQFLDYDNDGLLDLVAISGGSLRVLRNVGNKWMDASSAAVKPDLLGGAAKQEGISIRHLASGDTDADGDVDLIVSAGALKFARNDGGNTNRSMRVWLAGKVSNRSGVGAKVEARTGSLWQKLETYAASPAPAPADVVFGLGQRTAPDAVRVLWPAGIVQAETEVAQAEGATGANNAKNPALAQSLTVTELDRKPSSCPYLFAWNGERFEFISDFMGGGEMGAWLAPGIRNQPDSDEYVRIRSDQLKERDGRYELRVTHELEEVLFMDRLKLIAVAHPADVEVYPNEGLTGPPHRPFKLYATHAARPPAKAVDDHGHDMLPRIAELDRQYPDDFKLHRLRGYAETHSLTLDLNPHIKGSPQGAADERTLLLLTGWTDYAFSSDNVAAEQCGMSLLPPALQVRNAKGEWQTVIPDMGIPIGRPQTVTVDLTGKFLSSSREVRITTNMRIYWDRILVDTSDGKSPTAMIELEPAVADLRWRGFSAEQTSDGREPFGYTYELVSSTSPWKTMLGRYTREGDVRPLLSRTDDMFVIARTGDQISVSFDATELPRLPVGWTRTFLLYVDGFSKEMDINSASPDQVMPLPFHGMSGYPYKATETYPQTWAHREYMERYNTRVVASQVATLAK